MIHKPISLVPISNKDFFKTLAEDVEEGLGMYQRGDHFWGIKPRLKQGRTFCELFLKSIHPKYTAQSPDEFSKLNFLKEYFSGMLKTSLNIKDMALKTFAAAECLDRIVEIAGGREHYIPPERVQGAKRYFIHMNPSTLEDPKDMLHHYV